MEAGNRIQQRMDSIVLVKDRQNTQKEWYEFIRKGETYGVKTGPFREYYLSPEGEKTSLASFGLFVDGDIQKKVVEYYKGSGAMKRKTRYPDEYGIQTMSEYFENGGKKREVVSMNNTGEKLYQILWGENKKILRESVYFRKGDLVHELTRKFYPDGQNFEEYTARHDVPKKNLYIVGTAKTWYHWRGNLAEEATFDEEGRFENYKSWDGMGKERETASRLWFFTYEGPWMEGWSEKSLNSFWNVVAELQKQFVPQ